MSKRIRVELVGLFPTVFTTMCKAVCNPAGVAGLKTLHEQLNAYPEDVREDLQRASQIFAELVKRSDVEVRTVQANSFRGLWLTLKHRLPRGLWAVVDGKMVMDARRVALDEIISGILTVRAKKMAIEMIAQPGGVSC